MDGFSLVVGSLLGALIIWAFLNASIKQREANGKFGGAKKAKEDSLKKAEEAKQNQEAAAEASVESFLWSIFAIFIIVIFGIVIFNLPG